MRQPCHALQKDLSQGFVLLEVLVAMSLILGAWMALVGSYQNLALRSTQTESKKAQLRKEFDAFEMSEQARVRISTNIKGQINESTRVSSRHRAKHATSEPASKNKR
jgi:prepilin-type N-terminal cleavage/methylation domain-containing protein